MKNVILFVVFLMIAGMVSAACETQVNTFTTSTQRDSSVGIDANGNYVIAWASFGQDGNSNGVFAQRYNSAGNEVGSEFQVNTFTTDRQDRPSVAMDANGNFVIAWASFGQDGNNNGIFAQRYDNTGSTVGSEFQVNTFTFSAQEAPSVAMDANGNFVIAWTSLTQDDGSAQGIFAQRYDSAGNKVGLEFQVNTFTFSTQDHRSVAMDPTGNFVIAWTSFGQDGSRSGIFAQRYDNTGGIVGSEFQVNTFTTDRQDHPSVAMDANGNFVVAWASFGQDGSGRGVFAQRYDNTGGTVGSEFQVNTFTTNFQGGSSIAMDPSGNFLVAWDSLGQDGSGSGLLIDTSVYAQRYDSAGNKVGLEFQVNTFTTNDQADSSIAMDPTGNFVIAWTSFGQDGSGGGVFSRLGDLTPNTCGDGFIEIGEQCDGSNSCGNCDFATGGSEPFGPIGCTSSCTFDTSQCFACESITGNQQVNLACCVTGNLVNDAAVNHGQYVGCVKQEVNSLIQQGVVTRLEGGLIVMDASRSSVGVP